MRDQRVVRCTYYIETDGDPRRGAEMLAGEQSSGTFVAVPGETDRIRVRHAAEVTDVRELGEVTPSLPSRTRPERVRAAEVVVQFPMENIGTDLATLHTTVAGNLFELVGLFGCRLQELTLPDEFIEAHPGPAFGVEGTRKLIGGSDGAFVGTIVKPNVGLSEPEFRSVVRELARASIDLIKDDELMTDPGYLPLETRVRVAMEEIHAAEQVTGRKTMYAFNITGDLAGLRRRHDLVVGAGGTCVMLTVPVMGLPALAWLRSFSAVPIHGHRGGLAAAMRHPGLGVSYRAWQKLARLAGADHLHVSGLRSKFYELDDEVAANIAALREPLGNTILPIPALSSGQNVHTPEPTFQAVGTTDVMMLAGGGIAAHPDGPGAGVRSLRQAWAAAAASRPVTEAADDLDQQGDSALLPRTVLLRGDLMTTFGFLADDLTGAADVLAQAHAHGMSAMLVLDPHKITRSADVVGIAGPLRSQSGTALESGIRAGLDALAHLNLDVVLYKVCSTFDSSPTVGNIGRAIELLIKRFPGHGSVPVLPAQPEFGRYTAFSQHFGVYQHQIHRLDRHPVMAHHPSTPMTESDLRRVLSTQLRDGSLPQALHLTAYSDGTFDELWGQLREHPGCAFVVDAVDPAHMDTAARALIAHRPAAGPAIIVGSGGIMAALARNQTGQRQAIPTPPTTSSGPTLVVSASASSTTAAQIDDAVAHGWVDVPIPAEAFAAAPDSSWVQVVQDALTAGRDVIAHTARGPKDLRLSSGAGSDEVRWGDRGRRRADGAVRTDPRRRGLRWRHLKPCSGSDGCQ